MKLLDYDGLSHFAEKLKTKYARISNVFGEAFWEVARMSKNPDLKDILINPLGYKAFPVMHWTPQTFTDYCTFNPNSKIDMCPVGFLGWDFINSADGGGICRCAPYTATRCST